MVLVGNKGIYYTGNKPRETGKYNTKIATEISEFPFLRSAGSDMFKFESDWSLVYRLTPGPGGLPKSLSINVSSEERQAHNTRTISYDEKPKESFPDKSLSHNITYICSCSTVWHNTHRSTICTLHNAHPQIEWCYKKQDGTFDAISCYYWISSRLERHVLSYYHIENENDMRIDMKTMIRK